MAIHHDQHCRIFSPQRANQLRKYSDGRMADDAHWNGAIHTSIRARPTIHPGLAPTLCARSSRQTRKRHRHSAWLNVGVWSERCCKHNHVCGRRAERVRTGGRRNTDGRQGRKRVMEMTMLGSVFVHHAVLFLSCVVHLLRENQCKR